MGQLWWWQAFPIRQIEWPHVMGGTPARLTQSNLGAVLVPSFRLQVNNNSTHNKMTTKPRYELLDDMECVVATADRLQDLACAQALNDLRRPLFFDTKLGRCVEAPQKETD